MPVTLDATPKGASSNSYITQADADTYFLGRMNADNWTNAASSDKDQALVAATSRLDVELYVGVRSAQGQRLKWPRLNVVDEDNYLLSSDVVPRFVQEACCELALDYLNAGTEDRNAPTGLEGFESVRVGPVSVTRDKAFMAGQLPAVVLRLISAYRVSPGGFRVARG